MEARCVEGEALGALGRLDEALAVLREAKDTAVVIGATPARWRLCLALGRALVRAGRHVEAASEREEARAALAFVASTLEDSELRRRFEGTEPWRESNPGGQARTG